MARAYFDLHANMRADPVDRQADHRGALVASPSSRLIGAITLSHGCRTSPSGDAGFDHPRRTGDQFGVGDLGPAEDGVRSSAS